MKTRNELRNHFYKVVMEDEDLTEEEIELLLDRLDETISGEDVIELMRSYGYIKEEDIKEWV